WDTIAVPRAVVRHIYSGTAGFGSARKAYYLARNRWWCIGKNMPDALMQRHASAIAAYDTAAQVYALATGDRASLAERYAALRDWAVIARARAAVQARKTATDDAIAAWLTPAPMPLESLRQRRRLAALIPGPSHLSMLLQRAPVPARTRRIVGGHGCE